MNPSQFCRYCCKGYDHEDARHHNCLHANCPSCKRRRNEHSQGCIEFTGWSNPTITCKECNRQFFGEDCYQAHLIQTKQEETKMAKDLREQVEIQNDITIPPKETFKSVCEIYKKCNTCLVSYKEGVQHKCGHGQCCNCLDYVDLYSHKCCIVSDIYRENKRREIKHKSEERCLEAIKLMSTTEGDVVQYVAKKPITYKERDEEKRQKHPPLQEQAGPTRQESIDEVKKKLQDLGVDFTVSRE